ncbi:MAG: protein kinase [Planctomycetes bacterium]|nr:protein kinase [Planctomycetota bacterium]
MKRCPFCSEEIQETAVKCRFCGEFLKGAPASVNDAVTGSVPASPVLCGRYEIERELGRGGMGVVYLARDRERNGAEVAIKVLAPELSSDPRAVEDLRREADLAMSLSHPNVVRLHNLERDEATGTRLLVMEYVAGGTLALDTAPGPAAPAADGGAPRSGTAPCQGLAQAGKVPIEKVAAWVAQALNGLAYAHSKKVIHRDLKPSNLMRDADGTVKIADFGIARRLKDSMTRLTGRAATGTLLYMSPEQVRGEATDERSDIYSMGCVLYELLAGRPPFATGSIEWQILNQMPPEIEGVPAGVNQAIARAMAKRPEERFASAVEMAGALSHIHQGQLDEELKALDARKYEAIRMQEFALAARIHDQIVALRKRTDAGKAAEQTSWMDDKHPAKTEDADPISRSKRGDTLMRDAATLEENGKWTEAMSKYQDARQYADQSFCSTLESKIEKCREKKRVDISYTLTETDFSRNYAKKPTDGVKILDKGGIEVSRDRLYYGASTTSVYVWFGDSIVLNLGIDETTPGKTIEEEHKGFNVTMKVEACDMGRDLKSTSSMIFKRIVATVRIVRN